MTSPSLPPVATAQTRTLVKTHCRYSCCSLPALRQIRVALAKCSPVQQARISLGEALSARLVKQNSCAATLPAPRPPSSSSDPELIAPQLHDLISISFLCFGSVDSPSMPSSLRK